MRNKRIILLGVLLAGVILISGCAGAGGPPAGEGNTVQVQYTGRLKDGTIFDTSVGKDPLEFTLGAGQMIPGFERAVLGMKVGETKTVTIPSADAYGPHIDGLTAEVSRSEMPEGMTPRVGQKLQVMGDNGRVSNVTITAVTETMVTIDANHPLAGKDLIFEIKLLSIK